MSDIKTVGVLGCGLMGAGIAQVSAAAGYKTIVREVEEPFLNKGLGRIQKFLADGVEKGKVTPEAKEKTLANLSGTTRFEDLAGCDVIIEAIIENVTEKAKAFAALDAAVKDHTIFCSNTSSLCVTELAAKTRRPDRFAGLHFFNPVPIMFAAIQKCPSGRFGSRVAAVRPASMPLCRMVLRSPSAACPPSQYRARASFHAASKSRGFFCSRWDQISAA